MAIPFFRHDLFALVLIMVIAFFACKESESSNKNKAKTIAPISIQGLQHRAYDASLVFEKQRRGTDKWTADLWSYYSDSLKIYALIHTPKMKVPENGFPILIFGHGFHPEPRKYGVSNKTGKDWRPGDYYRDVPEGYAEEGFLTITPDYRGHNISDGFEYTQTSCLASTYYAIDVLHLLAAIKDLKNVDLNRIYYMGHSMGGDVGLKMLLANNKINAASLWAPVSANSYNQAIYYGKYYDKNEELTTNKTMQQYLARMDSVISTLDFQYAIEDGDPINFIAELKVPLIIHHGRWENAVPYIWSENLATKLYQYQKPFEFYVYNTDNHLFQNKMRALAIERDIAFFNQY